MNVKDARILILCKTYPSPSSNYIETSCVAGMLESGELIRLYPVPFRLMDGEQQFKKWQWVQCKIKKASKDHRQESHRIFVDTIVNDAKPIATKDWWAQRLEAIRSIPVLPSFEMLDRLREHEGRTLGLLRPAAILRLEITKAANPEWTAEELSKLRDHQNQLSLFNQVSRQDVDQDLKTLRKLPYDFHYVCRFDGPDGQQERRLKIVDWEIGALYWNCERSYGRDWEKYFRLKVETELPAAHLMFMMGNIHRFPDQWLIVSLLYPPKPQPGFDAQQSLFQD